MQLPGFYGNRELKRALAPLDKARFPHTAVIAGPVGSGKRFAARLIAAALVCRGKEPPCMECTACRKVMSAGHPDVSFIDNTDGKMKVAEVRELRAEAAVRPGEADRRIFIIAGADKLRAECQNALLSILEEPPAGVCFILLAESEAMLLQTVRSRAVILHTSPLTSDEMLTLLKERFPIALPEERAKAAALSQGFAGRAAELMNGAADKSIPFAETYFKALSSLDELSLFEACRKIEDFENADMPGVFALLRQTVRDAALIGAGLDVPEAAMPETSEILADAFSGDSLAMLASLYTKLAVRCRINAGKAALTAALAAGSAEVIR